MKEAIEIGPVGLLVGERVRELRQRHGWNVYELADEVFAAGRAIGAAGIGRLERGHRRVDVDDLVALASALHVDVLTLLMRNPGDLVTIADSLAEVTARRVVEMLAARQPSSAPPDEDPEAAQ